MATPSAGAVMTAELLIVRQLYGTSLIGFALATTIYGISVLQVYLYYRCYPNDRFMLKFTVALLFLLDTLGSIHAIYAYHVFNFFKPLQSLQVDWSFAAENFLVTATTFVAQTFYAHTIWKATSSRLTTGIIMLMALTSLALGTVTTQELFNGSLAVVSTRRFAILSGLVQGFASLNDVSIACLCYYPRRNRGDLPTGREIVDTLMHCTNFVLGVGLPGQTYWQPFHQIVGKLYVNSVLATLNVRSTFTQKSEIQLGTRPSFRLTSAGSTGPSPTRHLRSHSGFNADRQQHSDHDELRSL
ncbi:hypothetical protein B0H19DRAFT_1269470 [Mycena capillaripes]|nr:hypothetical protein B0H19DRAFT_1269470 [Mycena capillaripes]